MTVTTRSAEDESRGQVDTAGDAAAVGGVSLLGAPSTGERCVTCGAELAVDQRYCVECGTRRGRSDFPAPSTRGPSGSAVARTERRLPGSATLLALLATLLLAFGVGVLIGHSTAGTTRSTIVRLSIPASGVTAGRSSRSNSTTGSSGSSGSTGSSGTASSKGSSSSSSSGNFFH